MGENQEKEIRALIRTRYGNMEEDNKYWLEKEKSAYFVGRGRIIGNTLLVIVR